MENSYFVGPASGLKAHFEGTGVTDILINGTDSLYVERNGQLEYFESPFQSREELSDFIERLLFPIGKRVDAARPYIDGRLLDGTRFHVILPPIAPSGPLISFRRHVRKAVSLEQFGTDSQLQWLLHQVHHRKNILISGGTGAGKTTLLMELLNRVAPTERILTVEESTELFTTHPHRVALESRVANPEGFGEVTLRQLMKNALRMRPDRIILGECRGGEAFEFLQAMNSGHAGTMGTIHANSARDALRRLEVLVLLGGVEIPLTAIREWIASNLAFVVHLDRQDRKITEILEVHGLEGEIYRLTPVLGRPLETQTRMCESLFLC